MNARHDFGFVGFKLGVIGQVLTEMPEDRQNANPPGNSHEEEHTENT